MPEFWPLVMLPFFDLILLAMTVGTCLFCIALIARECFSQSRWPSHAVALMGFFVIMFAEAVDALNIRAPDNIQVSGMIGFTLPMVPALGACMWFYIRGLTSSGQHFARLDLWHTVPVLIIVGCTIPFLALPTDQRQSFVSDGINLRDPNQVTAVIFMIFGWLTWIAILILYGFASMRRLLLHRAQIKKLFSNVEGVSLAWINVLIIIVFMFTGLAVVGALFPAAANIAQFAEKTAALFYFCLAFVVGTFGVLQKSVIPDWSELDLSSEVKQKYTRSALQENDMLRITRKLDETMRDNHLWQNPNLSLHDFSRATGVSQNNVSQTLNDHLNKNFYDYVNGWRVDAACIALRDTDLSVLNISLDVGFNAKSTFNAAFKKVTGQTPRQFRNDGGIHKIGANVPDRSKPI